MKTRTDITNKKAWGYKRPSRKEKMLFLNEFVQLTGYNRRYATRCLLSQSTRVTQIQGGATTIYKVSKPTNTHIHKQFDNRERPPTYPQSLIPLFTHIWDVFNNLFANDSR